MSEQNTLKSLGVDLVAGTVFTSGFAAYFGYVGNWRAAEFFVILACFGVIGAMVCLWYPEVDVHGE